MSSPESIDLSDAVPLETAVLEMKHPVTKKPLGWKLTLAGPQHQASIDIAAESGRDLIEEERAIRTAQANGQKYEADLETLAVRRRRNVNRVCRRILSWSPNPIFRNVQAAPIEFSPAAATDLFMRPDMAGYLIQLTVFLGGEKDFMPPSGTV
jgi:hypothetical protein